MKLKISEIPPEGMDIDAEWAKDSWLDEVMREAFRRDYGRHNKASINLFVEKTCDNVSLKGIATIDLEQSCDRCLEKFRYHSSIPVGMTLAPFQNVQEGGADEITTDDENFSFYQGEEVDLSGIVREALVLAMPIRYLCQESCKGICSRCGANLNQRKCRCQSGVSDQQFAALKKFRFKKK